MTVKFKDNSAEVKKAMQLLEKKALQESAKLIRKAVKKDIDSWNGVLKKNVGTWVRKGKGGGVWLQIGVYNRARAKKRSYTYAFHAHLYQFGTVHSKPNPFLTEPVKAMIPAMIAKQAEYLGYLSSEAEALAKQAKEKEEVDDS